jgi:hypothetical protein
MVFWVVTLWGLAGCISMKPQAICLHDSVQFCPADHFRLKILNVRRNVLNVTDISKVVL